MFFERAKGFESHTLRAWISWEALNLRLPASFDVLVTDIDYPCPGTEYIPQIAWTGTLNILTNPSEWGRITLAE